MSIILLVILISTGSSLYQAQKKYDYCKEIDFETQYCELQKKLCESSKEDC